MSGPGLITVNRPSGVLEMSALLYNFDVGSASLKTEHITWIRSTLFPWTTIRDVGVLVVGLTSRTGSDVLNMKLSKARAEAVSRELFLLSKKMPVETTAYAGERAAALVGVEDGVENDRWRSVYIHVGDTRTYSPPARPNLVKRRTHATVVLKEEQKTMSGGEPGEKAYQAAQALRRGAGWTSGILAETNQMIDESFVLRRITIEKSNSAHGIPLVATYEIDYLHVSYDWGPWDTKSSLSVTFTHKKLMQSKGPPKDHVTMINPVAAQDWLERPLWAFNNI